MKTWTKLVPEEDQVLSIKLIDASTLPKFHSFTWCRLIVSSTCALGLTKETKIHSCVSVVPPFKILDSDSKILRGSLSKPIPSIASKRFIKDLHKLILCGKVTNLSHIKSPSVKFLNLLTHLCLGSFFFLCTYCDWNMHSVFGLRISVFFLQSTNEF